MSERPEPASPQPDDVDPMVLDAVVDAFYPRAVALGDSARNRAQAAYAILSALIGSALSVAVIASDQASGPLPVIAVIVAAAMWFVAALMYLGAIAGPVDLEAIQHSQQRPAEPSPQAEFVWDVLDQAKTENRTIRRRQGRATVLAVSALAVTLFSVAFFALGRDTTREAIVFYGTSVEAPIRQECRASGSISGEVVLSSLAGDDVVVHVDPPTCGPLPRVLYIPADSVRIVVLRED